GGVWSRDAEPWLRRTGPGSGGQPHPLEGARPAGAGPDRDPRQQRDPADVRSLLMSQPSRESALRDQLATAGRILAQEGHGHLVYGHLSARRDEATFLVKPAGIGLEELTPDSLVVMD